MGDTSPPTTTIPLGLYLWTRIHQLGINHIFGVPGDFNLTLLDHIYSVPGLEWVGNTNELNAAYAADGYARVHGANKNGAPNNSGASCVVTTHGVGELSALNGIAGSLTEQLKVIHVVGQTSRAMQTNRMMIHHSIGFNPDHQIFNKASREFRVAAAELQSEVGAAEEIDRVLTEMFVKSGPVYIYVPIDIVPLQVDAERLKTPLDLVAKADDAAVDEAAKQILEILSASKNPAFFVDCLVQRRQAVAETRELIDALGLPVYTSNMGKGLIHESNANYVGIYQGIPSAPGVAAAFDKHDVVLVLGSLPADTNSGGFNRKIAAEVAINVNTDAVEIQGKKTYSSTPLKAVLQRLNALVGSSSTKMPVVTNAKAALPGWPAEADANAEHITQSWIWHRMAKWMKPYDVVLGETGTAAYGIPDGTFPDHINWQTQTYYGSIGWATPAALGIDLALRDLSKTSTAPRGRTLLFTGDGSMMLTVQEIGNMVKHHLSPLIFIINNSGYTIERVIHGARQSYNDVVPFNYSHLLPFLGCVEPEEAKGQFHRATTKAELEAVLELPQVVEPKAVQVVEIVMETMDVPLVLATLIAMRGPAAVQEMREAGFKVPASVTDTKGFWN